MSLSCSSLFIESSADIFLSAPSILDRLLASSLSLASSAASLDKSRKTRSLFKSMSSLVGLVKEGGAT